MLVLGLSKNVVVRLFKNAAIALLLVGTSAMAFHYFQIKTEKSVNIQCPSKK